MPLLNTDDYRPGYFLRNGHVNTIYPPYFRKIPKLDFQRERIPTPDNDFLDIDFIKNDNRKVALICHGLEGSSASQYVSGNAALLSKNGWDIAALNYRSCSGELNNRPILYHSGATYDLETVIKYLDKTYEEIDLIGYSLGGNLVLKYLGENPNNVPDSVRGGVAVSAPIDLDSASFTISKTSNWHYNKNFMLTLLPKVKAKHSQFPDLIDPSLIKSTKSLIDFDENYTAPIHGFEDAMEYYLKSKAIQFIPDIKIPALLINALDDPFLSKECYPFEMLEAHPNVWFAAPKYGGHCGFAGNDPDSYWVEEKILWFLKEMVQKPKDRKKINIEI